MPRTLMVGAFVVLLFGSCSTSDSTSSTVTTTAATTTSAAPSTTAEPATTPETTAATTTSTAPTSTTTTTIELPVLSDGWSLESGDLLVSSGDGLTVVRSEDDRWSPVYTILAEPVLRAFGDGSGGVVFQPGDPYEGFGPIWHIPRGGAEPELVAELVESSSEHEEFEPLLLLTAATIDGDRVALFRRFSAGYVDGVMYGYSLTTGETTALAPGGEGEFEVVSAAWVGDHFVYTFNAEGNAYIGEIDEAGMWEEAPLGEPLRNQVDPDMGASARVAPDTGDTVVIAYESMYWCAEGFGYRIGRFEVNPWQPKGTVHQIERPAEENCGIESLETLDNQAAVHFGGDGTFIVDLDTGTTTPLPLSGPTSFVP